MQIEIFKENSVSFKLSDNDFEGSLQMFYSVMKKVQVEAARKGFKNMFDSNEKLFIREFTKAILENKDDVNN